MSKKKRKAAPAFPAETTPGSAEKEDPGFSLDLADLDVPDFDRMVFDAEHAPQANGAAYYPLKEEPPETAAENAASENAARPAPQQKKRYGASLLDPLSEMEDEEDDAPFVSPRAASAIPFAAVAAPARAEIPRAEPETAEPPVPEPEKPENAARGETAPAAEPENEIDAGEETGTAPENGAIHAEASRTGTVLPPVYTEEADKPDRGIKPEPGEVPYIPYETTFHKLFGEDRFYGVATIVAGVYAFLWSALYLFVWAQRSMMFQNAQNAMNMQGQLYYTISFSSPLLGVLRVMLYLLPVVLLLWVVGVKHADLRGLGHGKKKVAVVVLALLGLICVLALLDLGRLGLVFDIAKQ